MVVRWAFEDPVTDDVYTFEVNPNEGGTPPLKKTVGSVNTTAPGGLALLFEGQDEVPIASFSGVVLTRGQYDAMRAWFRKRYPIRFTDHLARRFTVYVTALEAKPGWRAHHPWRHTYTVTYMVLAEEDPP